MRVAYGLVGLLIACGSPPGDEPVPGEITVAVSSPLPGAELLASDHPSIVVTGTVTTTNPDFGELAVFVNGVRHAVVGGAFTAEVAPKLGINHLEIEGSDGRGQLVGKELDVLWAPEFLPPLAGQTGFDIAGALELRLGQRFFDARLPGSDLDLSTDPVVARDVASALELILRHVDLAGLLTGGIQIGEGDASLEITIPAATPSSIVVDARIVDGAQPAIDLRIDMLGVFLAAEGSFRFAGRTLVIDGGITADLHASARLTVGTAADGSIDVAVTGVTAAIGPLVPAFEGADGDELDAFIRIADSDFRTLVEQLIADELIPTFTDRVPPLLESLLGATDELLDNVMFTLDTGLGAPVTLLLDGQIGGLDLDAGQVAGHATVRQDIAVRTTGAPLHAASRGAPRLEALAAEPALTPSGVHLAMRQDFLNALLHALWNAGMLDGQVTFGLLSANVAGRLPPVIMPTPPESACKIDGERCDVVLQLGQVEVTLPDFNQSFGVNAQAGARIKVDGGTVSLLISPVPELRVWELSSQPGTLVPDTVRELIATLVWPELFGAIGSNLTIALPLPDLAALGLGDLAPGLASAQLALEMRQRPNVSGGRLVLGADLTFATPPPPPRP